MFNTEVLSPSWLSNKMLSSTVTIAKLQGTLLGVLVHFWTVAIAKVVFWSTFGNFQPFRLEALKLTVTW